MINPKKTMKISRMLEIIAPFIMAPATASLKLASINPVFPLPCKRTLEALVSLLASAAWYEIQKMTLIV